MPIYRLDDRLIFPNPAHAEEGIVAVGGDLSAARLMLAYRSGIFPWFSEGEPITWWSPDPRCVLFPEALHVSRFTQRILDKGAFKVTYNQDFRGVITQCSKSKRKGQTGTWITREMIAAYISLHEQGHALSVEVWQEDQLVGGMYGVDLGHIFCGESMFSQVSNASKVGLVSFVRHFQSKGGTLLDCQVFSPHLSSMGATEISRADFLNML